MLGNTYDEASSPRKQYAIETRSSYTNWVWNRWLDWNEEDELESLIATIEREDPCTGEVEFRIVEREVTPKKVSENYTWQPPSR